MAPSEIEGMTVRCFNEYLKAIPAVERVFKGGSAAQEGGEQPSPPGGVADLLKFYGLEVPDDG